MGIIEAEQLSREFDVLEPGARFGRRKRTVHALRVTVCGLNPVPQRQALARTIGVVFGQRSQLWWDLPLQDSFPILAAMHRMPCQPRCCSPRMT